MMLLCISLIQIFPSEELEAVAAGLIMAKLDSKSFLTIKVFSSKQIGLNRLLNIRLTLILRKDC